MITKQKKGFTLIEILIVVAIIAILASVVLVGLGPTQQAGRDARRLSDLHEMQNGLELFYNKCGYYPGTAPSGVCAATATTGYSTGATPLNAALTGAGLQITTVPMDPTSAGTHSYGYATNGASASQYILTTVFENGSNSVFTSYTPLTTTQIAVYGSGDAVGTCASPEYCITL